MREVAGNVVWIVVVVLAVLAVLHMFGVINLTAP